MSTITGRRCDICKKPIQQNEKLFTNGKVFAHKHETLDLKSWKEIAVTR